MGEEGQLQEESVRASAASQHIFLGLDLTFDDADLERRFRISHNKQQIVNDASLALGIRLVGWTFASYKAFRRGMKRAGGEMLALALPSSLLPLFGMMLGWNNYASLYLREFLTITANALQFYFTAHYYDHLYPCSEDDVTLWRSFAAVFSGNGVLFLVATSLMGSLIFKWLLVSQYAFFLILVLNNESICRKSPALRQAYIWFHTKCWRGVIRTCCELFGNQVNFMQSYFSQPLSILSPFTRMMNSPLSLCVVDQAILQLVFGLWIPCYAAFQREMSARKDFLVRSGISRTAHLPSTADFVFYALPTISLPLLVCMMIPSYS